VAEELTAVRTANEFELVRARLQAFCEPAGSLLAEFRRSRVDDDDDLLLQLRERLVEGKLLLPPRQIRRDQLVDVGIDREMAYRVGAATHRDQDRKD
jgi:hypothetical protein